MLLCQCIEQTYQWQDDAIIIMYFSIARINTLVIGHHIWSTEVYLNYVIQSEKKTLVTKMLAAFKQLLFCCF